VFSPCFWVEKWVFRQFKLYNPNTQKNRAHSLLNTLLSQELYNLNCINTKTGLVCNMINQFKNHTNHPNHPPCVSSHCKLFLSCLSRKTIFQSNCSEICSKSKIPLFRPIFNFFIYSKKKSKQIALALFYLFFCGIFIFILFDRFYHFFTLFFCF